MTEIDFAAEAEKLWRSTGGACEHVTVGSDGVCQKCWSTIIESALRSIAQRVQEEALGLADKARCPQCCQTDETEASVSPEKFDGYCYRCSLPYKATLVESEIRADERTKVLGQIKEGDLLTFDPSIKEFDPTKVYRVGPIAENEEVRLPFKALQALNGVIRADERRKWAERMNKAADSEIYCAAETCGRCLLLQEWAKRLRENSDG